jgi:subtilisin family serine protease
MSYGISLPRCTNWLRRATKQATAKNSRTISLFILLGFLSLPAFGQSSNYWIAFRDRGPSVSTSDFTPQALGISDRALWRRSKVLPPDRLIDELDLPVYQLYIDQLRLAGIVVRSTSRWLNAVSAQLTDVQKATLSSIPCVASIGPVAQFLKRYPETKAAPGVQSFGKNSTVGSLNYGPSITQLATMKITDVHAQGINGAGVIVGMLDDGFNLHKVHPALKNIKVIAEYDFVQRDSNTSIAPGEFSSQGNHGEETLSLLGGFDDGKLIGAAYGASFILAKTEVDSTETSIEEDYWVEGLEWEEQLGADIVSSSLGYNNWYTYPSFDGQTATTTKAARIAARKGVLVVTAMGNEGNYRDVRTHLTGTLIAPADADSIVSVGAADSGFRIASFSSTGPTADGRVKPDVVGMGVSDYVVSGIGSYQVGSGTSFSTPLTAGVAALVLSAHPTFTPMQVRDRLISNARALYDSANGVVSLPNNFYGWGMVDAAKAVGVNSTDSNSGGSLPTQFVLHDNYPNPFNGSTTILVDAPGNEYIELAIYDLLGRRVRTLYRGTVIAGTNRFQWQDALNDAGAHVATGVYVVRLTGPGFVGSHKILYLK